MLAETKQTIALFLYYFVSAGQVFVFFTFCLFLCILWLLWEIVQNSQVSNTNTYDHEGPYYGYLEGNGLGGPLSIYDMYNHYYGGNHPDHHRDAFFNEMLDNYNYMLDQENWWENLANCEHIRLIIPPDVIQDQTGPELLRHVQEKLTSAKNKLFGAAAQGLEKIRGKAKGSREKEDKLLQGERQQLDNNNMDGDNPSSPSNVPMSTNPNSNVNENTKGKEIQENQSKAMDSESKTITTGDKNSSEFSSKKKSKEKKKSKTTKTLSKNSSKKQITTVSSDKKNKLIDAVEGNEKKNQGKGDEKFSTVVPPLKLNDLERDDSSNQMAENLSSRRAPSGSITTRAGTQTSGGHHKVRWYVDLLPEEVTPLLVFVNTKSGGAQGVYLLHQLRRLFNPIQVVDTLKEKNHIKDILEVFTQLPRLRILVCGGDGTAKWIMDTLETLSNRPESWPPIAMLPLGTGNDLARVLGWGGGYSGEDLRDILIQVQKAHIVYLTRWVLELKKEKGNQDKQKILKKATFNNYFGIGCDAQAALRFHNLREAKPQLFFNRFVNKFWFASLGAEDIVRQSCINLPSSLIVIGDGKVLQLPPEIQGIIILNIKSYAGGVKLWYEEDSVEDSGSSNIHHGSHGSNNAFDRHSYSSNDLSDHSSGNGWNSFSNTNTNSISKDQPRTSDVGKHKRNWNSSSNLSFATQQGNKVNQQSLGKASGISEKSKNNNASRHRSSNCFSHKNSDDYGYYYDNLDPLDTSMEKQANFLPPSMADEILEVVAVNGPLHLGQLQIGLSRAIKIGQFKSIEIKTLKKVPIQLDGEPEIIEANTICNIQVKPTDPKGAIMLKRTIDSGGAIATEMVDLLDWAVEKKQISNTVKTNLLNEFAKRVEQSNDGQLHNRGSSFLRRRMTSHYDLNPLTHGAMPIHSKRIPPDNTSTGCNIS